MSAPRYSAEWYDEQRQKQNEIDGCHRCDSKGFVWVDSEPVETGWRCEHIQMDFKMLTERYLAVGP